MFYKDDRRLKSRLKSLTKENAMMRKIIREHGAIRLRKYIRFLMQEKKSLEDLDEMNKETISKYQHYFSENFEVAIKSIAVYKHKNK